MPCQVSETSDFRSVVRDSTLSANRAAFDRFDCQDRRLSVLALLFGASFPLNGTRRAKQILRLSAKLAPDGGSTSPKNIEWEDGD